MIPLVKRFVEKYINWGGKYCHLYCNQAQPQLQLKLRLYSHTNLATQPPCHPATHPATRKSSDLELCLNSFSARELKFGTDTHYTNLIKII